MRNEGKSIFQVKFESICSKAWNYMPLVQKEIEFLLNLDNDRYLNQLFQLAQNIRKRAFGNKLFLHGMVTLSTWCSNECVICGYKKSNAGADRHRKTNSEVLDSVKRLVECGVHVVKLSAGEDPLHHRFAGGFKPVIQLVRDLKKETGGSVALALGLVPNEDLIDFIEAGADWYSCPQDTYNRHLFLHLRRNQSYCQRYLSKRFALGNGLLLEEGLITGVGETKPDIANALKQICTLGAQQVKVNCCVPGGCDAGYIFRARREQQKIIAVLRLLAPDCLIPAQLDNNGLAGLQAKLNAGANVISGLSGLNVELTMSAIHSFLEHMGLSLATEQEHQQIVQRKKWLKRNNAQKQCN